RKADVEHWRLENKLAPQGRSQRTSRKTGPLSLGFGLALDLALDGLARHLRRGRARLRGFLRARVAHAVLEAAHRAAEIGADVAQLLRAENHQHDDQQDDPVSDAPCTHSFLLLSPREHRTQWFRPTEDMHMHMIHLLMPHPAVVDDGAEAIRRAGFAGKTAGDTEHLAERRLVTGL